jgi:hypothetical protein
MQLKQVIATGLSGAILLSLITSTGCAERKPDMKSVQVYNGRTASDFENKDTDGISFSKFDELFDSSGNFNADINLELAMPASVLNINADSDRQTKTKADIKLTRFGELNRYVLSLDSDICKSGLKFENAEIRSNGTDNGVQTFIPMKTAEAILKAFGKQDVPILEPEKKPAVTTEPGIPVTPPPTEPSNFEEDVPEVRTEAETGIVSETWSVSEFQTENIPDLPALQAPPLLDWSQVGGTSALTSLKNPKAAYLTISAKYLKPYTVLDSIGNPSTSASDGSYLRKAQRKNLLAIIDSSGLTNHLKKAGSLVISDDELVFSFNDSNRKNTMTALKKFIRENREELVENLDQLSWLVNSDGQNLDNLDKVKALDFSIKHDKDGSFDGEFKLVTDNLDISTTFKITPGVSEIDFKLPELNPLHEIIFDSLVRRLAESEKPEAENTDSTVTGDGFEEYWLPAESNSTESENEP